MGKGGVGGVIAGAVALLSGAPWPVVFLAVVVIAVLLGLQTVFPQDSQHRLEWWRDRRDRKERCEKRRAVAGRGQKQFPAPRRPSLDPAPLRSLERQRQQ